MKLRGKTALVTGAGRGIGLATARRLVREGCPVTLWDLDADALAAARRELEGMGGTVFTHACDVTDKAEVARLARVANEEMGQVDILVNNAGVLFGGNIMDQPDAKWEKMIAVNLTSLLYTIRAFLPAMHERNSGHVVNVSSAAGTLGVSGLAVYAATKWAVWGLTESLRHESLNAGKRGVRWSSVHPNYIAEGMFAGARIKGLGGLLFPRLRDHDVAAKAIVESALKRGRRAPKRPRTVKLASLLRGIFPDSFFNAIVRFFKVHVSMESWTGRNQREESEMGERSGVQLRNPATGEPIGFVRKGAAADVKAAVMEARAAQPGWAALPLRRRTRCVRLMRDYIAAHADEISGAISRSTGKTRNDAMSAEVLPSAMAAAYYARIAPRIHRPARIEGGNILFFNKVSYLTRVPFGVVGIISPWNYPFSIPFHEVIMALLAGNAVVLKVATQTQAVGDCISEMVAASGLPKGVFHLVQAPGSVTGTAMLEAGVNKLFFTGSTAVGRELMAKAAASLTPVVLELGGNDAMIVLDDAGVERAAGGAVWAGLSNAGQSCAGVERVFVCPGIYDEFRKRLVHIVENLRIGADSGFDVDVGSLTQTEQKRKVDRFVADAVKKGASVVCRREAPESKDALFSPITVLENVNDSMLVMKDEVFGPVLAIQRVRDEEEAVRRANASPYGLTASVWSRSPRHARRIAERLEAGTVTLNDHLMSHGLAETPWGGFKSSGIGRSHGEIGFLEMSQPRVIVGDRLHRMPRNMWWYPHDKRLYDGLASALHFLYGKGLFSRLAAMARLAVLFTRSFRKGY